MRTALAILILLSAPALSGAEPFADTLAGNLVRLDPTSGELLPTDLPGAEKIEFFMLYFSAHWCGPCRKMTPALVEFYNETKAQHPQFEIILVSADHDQAGMHRYMEWAQIPWPAVAWDGRESIAAAADLEPRAIPFMAMLDKDGQLLGASDLGGFNVGIPKLLNGLQAKLGIEVYDVQERHGKKSPFVLAVYVIAGALLLISIVRRFLARRRGS